MASNGNLNRNQRRAIPALLKHRRVEDAAAATGLGHRTLHRWLTEDEAFKAELAKYEAIAIDEAVRQLMHLSNGALMVIGKTLADKNAADGVRLRAAGMALDYLLRFRELRDVEARLANLEATIYGELK